jgi:glycosyltransferase involved in cell wall biosynthesis
VEASSLVERTTVAAVAAPGISVVVPTRNRPASLRRCLAALDAQTASEPVEIVVVDDGSEDANDVAAIVRETPGARLVRQSRQGPGAARNAGVRAASGAVVCLTDDDCEPEPTWAATMSAAVRAGADVAAGEIVDDPRTRLEVASRVVTGSIATRGRTPFAASNNVAATARLLAELPFDEGYADAAGEDRDWCERVSARGYRIVRTGATVVHRQQPTLGGYLSRHARYGRGSYRYHRTRERPLERPGFYAALVRDGFREGPIVGLLVALAQLATAFGYAREALARPK